MFDCVNGVAWKKSDVLTMHVGTNDLTKGINTMSKVRKIVSAIPRDRWYWKYPAWFF